MEDKCHVNVMVARVCLPYDRVKENRHELCDDEPKSAGIKCW